MRENFQSFLRQCVLTMLQPVVDFCISRGLRLQDFNELAKKAFVLGAQKHLLKDGHDVSVSKLSVMTGVQRPEVKRLLTSSSEDSSKDFIVRIIGQWSSDRRFINKGRPKALSIEGLNSSFGDLVSTVSSDLNPHTVRFELERLGLIEVRGNRAHLISPVYMTTGDAKETLSRGAGDVQDLLICLQENAFATHDVPNLQARTEYDNIPDEALPRIRDWLVMTGAHLHETARAFLSKFDRDINPEGTKGSGRNRVVIGTYSRVHVLKDGREEK